MLKASAASITVTWEVEVMRKQQFGETRLTREPGSRSLLLLMDVITQPKALKWKL